MEETCQSNTSDWSSLVLLLFFILYFSSLFSTSKSIHNLVNFQAIVFKFSEYDKYD